MRISLRQLEIFCAVVDAGSTASAAIALSLSQSAASAALNELENLLGVTLFDRIGKRLLINDNGRVLLQQARHMLALATSVEDQFLGKETARRDLLIGASTTIGTYLLPALLASYCEGHPGLIPRVAIANTADVVSAVANFRVEIGFIEALCHAPELMLEPWIRDELIVVAAPGHPFALRSATQKVKAAKLAGERWLVRAPGSGTRDAVEIALLPHLHALVEAGEFSSSEAIKHACAAGLGLACLSSAVVADQLALGNLAQVNSTLPKLERTLYMVYSRKKILSAALEDFRDYCRSWQINRNNGRPR